MDVVHAVTVSSMWTGPGGMASVSCTCGQSQIFGFARPTGESVALRIARLAAARHQDDPSFTLDPLVWS